MRFLLWTRHEAGQVTTSEQPGASAADWQRAFPLGTGAESGAINLTMVEQGGGEVYTGNDGTPMLRPKTEAPHA